MFPDLYSLTDILFIIRFVLIVLHFILNTQVQFLRGKAEFFDQIKH